MYQRCRGRQGGWNTDFILDCLYERIRGLEMLYFEPSFDVLFISCTPAGRRAQGQGCKMLKLHHKNVSTSSLTINNEPRPGSDSFTIYQNPLPAIYRHCYSVHPIPNIYRVLAPGPSCLQVCRRGPDTESSPVTPARAATVSTSTPALATSQPQCEFP